MVKSADTGYGSDRCQPGCSCDRHSIGGCLSGCRCGKHSLRNSGQFKKGHVSEFRHFVGDGCARHGAKRRDDLPGYRHVKTAQGVKLEHRLVMERVLGRSLDTREHVHHINGDKLDNRLENLAVLDIREHARLHGGRREGVITLG